MSPDNYMLKCVIILLFIISMIRLINKQINELLRLLVYYQPKVTLIEFSTKH